MHRHYNGLKTVALFGVLWAVLLGLGALIGASTRSSAPIWIMALVGVATTAYGSRRSIAVDTPVRRPVEAATEVGSGYTSTLVVGVDDLGAVTFDDPGAPPSA